MIILSVYCIIVLLGTVVEDNILLVECLQFTNFVYDDYDRNIYSIYNCIWLFSQFMCISVSVSLSSSVLDIVTRRSCSLRIAMRQQK